GRGEFVDDVAPAGVLEGAFVRSPLAHARLVGVDVSRALAVPGVEAVLTARDLALPPVVTLCDFPNAFCPPRPPLAVDVVRYVGEAVALVVARSRYVAEDGAELVELDLEPLEPVGRDSAAAVHPDGGSYLESRVDVGAVDEAFASAAAVVERRF